MLLHSSPIEASNYLADYINANISAFSADIQAKALAAVRESSPVTRMCLGVEVLFAVVVNETAPARETGLNALGSASLQVAEGNFWGKQDRAIELMKWARFALGEWPEGIDPPDTPEIDPSLALPVTEWPSPDETSPGEGGDTPEAP